MRPDSARRRRAIVRPTALSRPLLARPRSSSSAAPGSRKGGPRKPGARKPRSPSATPPKVRALHRKLGLIALLLFGIAVGVLTPWLWAVDQRVREEFGALQWQVPTRVLARPLALQPGMALNAGALEAELSAAQYRNDGEALLPGRFARDGDTFRIATRGFVDLDGEEPARRVEITLAKGRVAALRSLADAAELELVRIDPARIATLYGTRQEERRLVKLAEVPPLLVTTLQAVEDREFKHHFGIDPLAIARALWVNLTSGEVRQGGSTLTQQLVRNLFLDRGQRFTRKASEAVHALAIEMRFDKGTILEAYLNQVYLGQDGGQAVHGVAAAADFWFGRALEDLGPPEFALLVGMIQGPSLYDPRRYPERALARRNLVLQQMADTGLIDAATLARSQAAPLGVTRNPNLARNRYPAFLDMVRRQLAAQYPEEALSGAGLTVLSTLAPSVQQFAEVSAQESLAELDKGRPALEVGMVVTSTQGGDVLAVVGGRTRHGFNRALDAKRPIGSLMKPFVYLLALAQPGRFALATPVEDAPMTVQLPRGRSWTPDNSDDRSHGWVRLVDALSRSYNQATVRVGMEIGVDRLVRLIEALTGLELAANPSLLLGAADLSPLETAQLYQFLAAGGQLAPLRAVRGVLDRDGQPLARYDAARDPAQAGDALAARLVTIALQRTATSGTAARLQADGLGWLKPAGKTGTSNDARDSWFAGYTGSHLAVVWVGNDDNEPTGLMGATGAMRVWSALFRALPTEPLSVGEEGLEWAWIDAEEFATTESDCPGAQRYAFVQGFLPREHSSCGWSQVRGWFDRDRDGRARDRRDERIDDTLRGERRPLSRRERERLRDRYYDELYDDRPYEDDRP